MATQKASYHKGKVSGQTGEKHMERDFDYERGDEHIDPSKTYLNVVKSYCPGNGSELSFYKERYTEGLNLQNEKYAKKGNYDRIRTIEEIYETKTKRPTEEILQYSKNGGVEIPKETYDSIIEAYVSKLNDWSQNHGNHFHILKYSTHYDEPEGMTHTHLRTIWDYVDEDGVVRIGQEEGMKQSGLEIPDPTKLQKDIARAEKHRDIAESYVTEWAEKKDDEGNVISRKAVSFSDKKMYDSEIKKYRSGVESAKRYNNRGMTWTELQREMWEDTLDEFGYECDRVRAPKRKHQSQKEWDRQMSQQFTELNAAKQEWQDMRDNERKYINETGSAEAQKLYDQMLEDAKEDALMLLEDEIAERKAEAEKEILYQRKQAEDYAESKKYEALQSQKEKERLELELQRQQQVIKENKPTLDLIQNRDSLIHQQDAQIQKNNLLLRQQDEEIKTVEKGKAIERKQSGFDMSRYGNISQFTDD